MPAGAGPAVAYATAVTMAADTAEHVVATAAFTANDPSGRGLLVAFTATITGAATGTVTLRIRQGSLTGTQIGQSATIAASASSFAMPGLDFVDTSAYATATPAAGSYVLTYQQSANSLGTINTASLTIETISTVA